MEKLNMTLVEGEITIKIRVATLLAESESENEKLVQEVLEDIVFDDLQSNINLARLEFDYDNAVDVQMDKSKAERYYRQSVSNDDWKNIVRG